MNLFRRNGAVMAFANTKKAANTKKVRNIVNAKSFTAGVPLTKKAQTVVVSSATDIEDTQRLDEAKLYDIPMIPVECSFGIVSVQPSDTIALQALTKKERLVVPGAEVTVVFAIRRPGCGACREHGLQLTQLANEEKIALVGAVKETGASTITALLELYEKYFHYPIYKDEQWKIFLAMGGRRISIWKLFSTFPKMNKRYKRKGIKNIPTGGDIWTQGGVLIFDAKGRLRYAYYENYGDELDVEELRRAIRGVRDAHYRHAGTMSNRGSTASAACSGRS